MHFHSFPFIQLCIGRQSSLDGEQASYRGGVDSDVDPAGA